MNTKLIFKIFLLAVCLTLVLITMRFLTSSDFKKDLQQFFVSDTKTISWCPDNIVDIQWLESQLPKGFSEKWSTAKAEKIAKTFCSVAFEPLDNFDHAQINFKPLLQVQSAEAKTGLLEWSPESKLYRVQGIVFKSSTLSRELLDEAK